jgi:hypothetical protein
MGWQLSRVVGRGSRAGNVLRPRAGIFLLGRSDPANLWNQRQRPSSRAVRSDLRNAFEPNPARLVLGSLRGRLGSGLLQRQMRAGLRSL